MATPENQQSTSDAGACRYLASKGQYITGLLNPTKENCGVGDGYCWCNQTQAHLGPDDDFVGRDRCTSGRGCFVALI